MSTDDDSPIALKRSARFFFAVSGAAALLCAYSAIGTLRYISESTLAEATVRRRAFAFGLMPGCEVKKRFSRDHALLDGARANGSCIGPCLIDVRLAALR